MMMSTPMSAKMGKTNMSTDKPVTTNTLLPASVDQSLKVLIKFTEDLIELAGRETMALVKNDVKTFTILQSEKKFSADRYALAAREFQDRVDEFQGAHAGLINTLRDKQQHLKTITLENNVLIQDVLGEAQGKVGNNLFDTQAMAQSDQDNKQTHDQ